MTARKRLLIVAHAPSDNTQKMLEAVIKGATGPQIESVEVKTLKPLDTQPEDINTSDAIIIGTTENLGYMAGLIKDVFDRCFYGCLDKTDGMPFALYIRAGHDGTGTKRAIESITSGMRWRLVQEPIICRGEFHQEFFERCEELGLSMAASLEAGII